MMTDLFGLEVYKVINDIVAQVLVNDPVHELEARECHWEYDTAVLVNVRRSHAEHLVQVLHVTFWVGWWGRGWRRGRHLRRWHWRELGRGTEGRRAHVMRMHRGRGLLVVSANGPHPVFSTCRAISANGVFARATLAMHFGIVHFKVNSL